MAVPHSGVPLPAVPPVDATLDDLTVDQVAAQHVAAPTAAVTALTAGSVNATGSVTTPLATITNLDATDADFTDLTSVVAALTTLTGTLATITDVDAGTLDTPRARFTGEPWHDAKAYGAVGDGVANDTTALQAAIDATPNYGTLYIARPAAQYLLTGRLTINHPMTIMAADAKLAQSTSNTGLFLISSSDVQILGVQMAGPQHATQQTSERAIEILGTSAAAPISRINIEGCRITGWGQNGILAKWAHNVRTVNNHIEDIYYAAIMYLSVVGGKVSNNTIKNVVGTPLGYGISLTRESQTSLTDHPRTSDIAVTGNTVMDVTNWEGIDTHAGERIAISGNTVTRCQVGIAVVPGDDGSAVESYAPIGVTVTGNTLDSGKTDGSASYGISFAGAGTVIGTPAEMATGAIVGNNIRNYGPDGAGGINNGAIYVNTTRGLVVSGNSIHNPSPIGISIYHDNDGYVVMGNTITDVFSDDGASIVAAIATRSTHNTGLIANNVTVRGGKSATVVNDMGLRIASDVTNSSMILGINDFSAATTPVSPSAADAKMSFHGKAPTTRTVFTAPTGTASHATFDTATVTLPNLAMRVKALIDDLTTYGIFG